MRKPAFYICENKDADQLRGNREADQRLCLRYTESTIPLLSNYESSSLKPYSVTAQPGLCRTLSETSKASFLTARLKLHVEHRWAGGCLCRDLDHMTKIAAVPIYIKNILLNQRANDLVVLNAALGH